MTINDICRDKRDLDGRTNSWISQETDMPLSTVTNFFAPNAKSKSPSFDTTTRICKVLNISVDAICGITTPGMDAHEINRIRVEHEKYKLEMDHTVDLYAQQSGHQDEVISRQDARIKELNDRVGYQKTAIAWLRGLSLCLAIVGVLAAAAAFMMLRYILSMV